MNKTTKELFTLLSSCTSVMVDSSSLLFPSRVNSISEAPELKSEFPLLSEDQIEKSVKDGSIEVYLFDHESYVELIHSHAEFVKNPNGIFKGKNTNGDEISVLPLFPNS